MDTGLIIPMMALSIPLLAIYLGHRRAMAKDKVRPMDEEAQQKEAQIMEELYHSIKKLRARVENLETIYMDKTDKER